MKQTVTLAEIESYFRKVAKTCGLGWGLAEEVGKTARWLAAFDLPGPELLLAHLQDISAADYDTLKPRCDKPIWLATGDNLCPVITSAAIADRSAQMLTGETIELGPVAYPLLLVATIGQAARHHKSVFTMRWAGVKFSCYKNGIRIEGNRDDLFLSEVESVSCRQTGDVEPGQLPATLAYTIDAEIWQLVDQLAFKTYAPATDLSRAGAGAGLTDND